MSVIGSFVLESLGGLAVISAMRALRRLLGETCIPVVLVLMERFLIALAAASTFSKPQPNWWSGPGLPRSSAVPIIKALSVDDSM